jgi:hypothetical protein
VLSDCSGQRRPRASAKTVASSDPASSVANVPPYCEVWRTAAAARKRKNCCLKRFGIERRERSVLLRSLAASGSARAHNNLLPQAIRREVWRRFRLPTGK